MSNMLVTLPDRMFDPAAFMHVDGTWDTSELQAGPDLYRFNGPVSWWADITNTGEAFLLTGTASVAAKVACARCLEDASFFLNGEIEGYILTGDDVEKPEDLDDDEFDVLPEDHTIDMEPHIVAALLMELPLIPLCDEECKGLCPKCGSNLNEGPCDCPPDDPFEDSPFAALAGLTFDK